MNLWELIKNGAEEGVEALKDGVSVFMAEAGKTSRIVKKRVELTSVQGNVRKTFIRLGSLTYDLHSRGEEEIYGNEEIKGLIGEVEDCKTRVREIEKEIEKIKREEGRKASESETKAEPQPPVTRKDGEA